MKITQTAQLDRKMTLDELNEFVERARANAIDGNALVFVRVNFGGGVREITVDGDKLRTVGGSRG